MKAKVIRLFSLATPLLLLLVACSSPIQPGNGEDNGGSYPSPSQDLVIDLSPPRLFIPQGMSQSPILYVIPKNGNTGALRLLLDGAPEGTRVSPDTITITGPFSRQIKVTVSSSAALGTYEMRLRGTLNSLEAYVELHLTVPPFLREGRLFVFYAPGYESDAELFLTWTREVLGKLATFFPDVLTAVPGNINVLLYPLNSGVDFGRAFADPLQNSINFLTPSMGQTRGQDATWYQGNIAHEYFHILYSYYRKSAGGHSYQDSPSWFREGVGEYARYLVLGEETFDRIYGQRYGVYIPTLLQRPLEDVDPYAGGSWALRFLHIRYGAQGIRDILKSPAPSFWEAVSSVTGLTQEMFYGEFRAWLQAQLG
ncbi:hypothetical protein [Thermus oshimai]